MRNYYKLGGVSQAQELTLSFVCLAECYISLACGCAYAARSHVFSLVDDMITSKATIMFHFAADFMEFVIKMNEFIKSLPIKEQEEVNKAIAKKIEHIEQTRELICPELDKVLSPIKEMFYGKSIEVLITGGGLVNAKLYNMVRAVTSARIVAIYAATEMCICTCTDGYEQCGVIGPPIIGSFFKLIDVPKLNFFSKDTPCPRGEVKINLLFFYQ